MRDAAALVFGTFRRWIDNPSKLKVKADDGGTFPVERKVVVEAEERGNNFKVGSSVAFTTPRDILAVNR